MDFEGERLKEKEFLTSRISETSRNIGYGLIAFFMIEGIGSQDDVRNVLDESAYIKISGLLGILVILSDYLQYLFGLLSTNQALNRKDADYAHNRRWPSYILRELFFWAKQVAAFFGVIFAAVHIITSKIIL